MPTPAQTQASRHNGAQSRGPTTQEGKARSARNSIRHGLCSSRFHLDDPSEQAAFDHLLRDLTRTWRAVDEAQRREVEQIAIATWRQGVVANVERALWTAIAEGEACAETGGDGLPSLNSINRYRNRIERDLKAAKANLRELQAERVKAVQAQMEKAKEFNSLNMLGALKTELGEAGFETFRNACTNEPDRPAKPVATADSPAVPGRRRAQKMARKQKYKK